MFFLNNAIASNGGGTVVGNGAGLVEGIFQNTYSALERILPNCFETNHCSLLNGEKETAAKIYLILKENINKKDRLVFLSEKLNPGFFTTGVSELYRIAKTGLDSNGPIYVNTDMLYDGKGHPALSDQDIMRVLVHELGHQTGVVDHASLDMLGTKISSYNETYTNYFSYQINEQNEEVKFSITNFQLLIFNYP